MINVQVKATNSLGIPVGFYLNSTFNNLEDRDANKLILEGKAIKVDDPGVFEEARMNALGQLVDDFDHTVFDGDPSAAIGDFNQSITPMELAVITTAWKLSAVPSPYSPAQILHPSVLFFDRGPTMDCRIF